MIRRTSDGRLGVGNRARKIDIRQHAAMRTAAGFGMDRRRIGLADQQRPGRPVLARAGFSSQVFCRDRTSVRPPYENRDKKAEQHRAPAFGRRHGLRRSGHGDQASVWTRRSSGMRSVQRRRFDSLKNIAGFLREPKNGFGGNRCDQVLESQENCRTETAGRQVSPREGRWMCMVIMSFPSIGSG